METLLTSTTTIRTITNISDNVSDKYLLSALREAQEQGLVEIIGQPLLDALKAMVEGGTVDYNEPYKRLLDHIKYYLCYKSVSNLCVIVSFKIDNIGVNQTSDENVRAVEMKDVFKMSDYYLQRSDFYRKRIQDYLLKNKSDFPELESVSDNQINPNLATTASTGLFLGGRRGRIL